MKDNRPLEFPPYYREPVKKPGNIRILLETAFDFLLFCTAFITIAAVMVLFSPYFWYENRRQNRKWLKKHGGIKGHE